MRVILSSLIAVFCLVSVHAFAQVPLQINYQGTLTNQDGTPVSDGSATLTFRIYDMETGGSFLWEETQTVEISGGVFSVLLGAETPLAASVFSDARWLSMAIGNDSEMTPRITLAAVPYSLQAADVPDSIVTAQKIVDGAVTLAKIDATDASPGQTITYDGTDISWSTPSGTGGLSLPYSDRITTDAIAFALENAGSGRTLSITNTGNGRAGHFAITSPENSNHAIYATTSGTGNAGYFNGLVTVTDSLKVASSGIVFSDGSVQTSAASGGSLTLPYAGFDSTTGNAFAVTQNSSGRAAHFEIMNSANASAALHVKSAGTGHTAVFESETSSNASVYATTEAGYGVWAKAGQYGAPIYGEITGADNLLASIIGKSAGSGSAGYFEATNTTKNTNAIYAKQTGAGTGLEAEIDNSANTKNAVHATTNGAGSAGYFKTTATNGDSATVMAVSHSYSSSAGQFENRTGNDAVVYLGGPLAGGDFQRFHGGQWPEYRVTLAEVSTAARFTNSSGNASVTMVYADTVAAAFTGLVDIVGDLWVRGGTLYKMAGAFAIDHPLDPANKILRHSFVESPEMTNIYKGRATLVNGEAVIELPDYFDALNHPEGREITLTSINGWSPLYMDGKIENNRCTVKTTEQGSLDQEFSWVIYGVRNDTYAREHPIIVEQEKGAEGLLKKGEYLSKPPKPGPQN